MGRALDAAGYQRTITLGVAPTDYRQAAARVAHDLRKAVGEFEWAWTMELGERGGIHHLHAVVRSPWVHRPTLRAAARRSGWAERVWISKGSGGGAYGSKWARYASKGLVSWSDALAANGGKKTWHWSRNYTGGVPMRTWVPRHAPGRDPGPWAVVPAWVVEKLVNGITVATQRL